VIDDDGSSDVSFSSASSPALGATTVDDCPVNATKFPLGDDSGDLYLGKCQTDGICFKSVHRQKGKIRMSYRYDDYFRLCKLFTSK
jgi:hypothetical protein